MKKTTTLLYLLFQKDAKSVLDMREVYFCIVCFRLIFSYLLIMLTLSLIGFFMYPII